MQPSTERTVLDIAQSLLRERRWGEAAAVVDEALGQIPAPSASRRPLLVTRIRALQGGAGGNDDISLAIGDALNEFPNDSAVLKLQALNELRVGRTAKAFGVWKRLARGGDVDALTQMVDILVSRARFAAANRLEPLVRRLGGTNAALDYDLIVLALLARDADKVKALFDTIDKSAAAPVSRLEQLRPVARAHAAPRGPRPQKQPIRHIGIAGVSYVGSTMLGVILGGMEGWAFAGETHWLTVARTDDNFGQSSILDVADETTWPTACRVCGRRCEVFTREFRLQLARYSDDWYEKIAARLGVRNLVTSDKKVLNYWERDPDLGLDLVIVYKSPLRQMGSELKQAIKGHGEAGVERIRSRLDGMLDRWAGTYLQHMNILGRNRVAALNWEAFVKSPEHHLEGLGRVLGAPVRGDACEHPRLGHFIGGNMGIDVAAIRASGRIELRPSNAPELPADLAERVAGHRKAKMVYGMLEARARSVFG